MDRAQARERLPHFGRCCLPPLVLLCLGLPCQAAANEPWRFDILRLKSGGIITGVVLEENGDSLRFQVVRQRPGEKTRVTTTTTIQLDEIARFDQKLSDRERNALKEKLQSLDPTGKGERARMEDVELKDGSWISGVKAETRVFCYASDHFMLISNANEEIVRRVAIRLDDIYSAYTRFLPPRINRGKKTKIYLVRSAGEYQAIVKMQGFNILNPAFFDVGRNEVLVKSDLEELGSKLAERKHQFLGQLRKIDAQETAFRREFPRGLPRDVKRRMTLMRSEVYADMKKDDAVFNTQAEEKFYQTLQHEAFHAYLSNFVYPPEQATVPRWLNEGLAQIFEIAIVEAGEIRIGHIDLDRFTEMKKEAQGNALLPVRDLLNAKPAMFLVGHAAQQQVSDKYYLNSWALAYYLMFERRLLGTKQLDEYTRTLKRGGKEPETYQLEAFQQLVNRPIKRFEREYHSFLLRLHADGRLEKAK